MAPRNKQESEALTFNVCSVIRFDLGGLYPKHIQNDMSAEASYITQFNQQATESIKNSIGVTNPIIL